MTRTQEYEEAVSVLSYDYAITIDGDVDDECDLHGYTWRSGASKIVILMDNYVLKTSFTYEQDEDEPYLDEEYTPNYNECPDYANMEYLLYQEAVARGIGYMFCKTEQCNDKVYKQEKVDLTCEQYEYDEADFDVEDYANAYCLSIFDGTAHQMEECLAAHELTDLKKYVKCGAMPYILAEWNKEELHKLLDFCRDYDINDIHNNNIGWLNGELKIFDFCGFNSNTQNLLN